jgi:hypothetical protein
MSETVTANDGAKLPLDSLPMTITYSGNLPQTFTVSFSNQFGFTTTYTQTFTYSGTNVIAISGWIAS